MFFYKSLTLLTKWDPISKDFLSKSTKDYFVSHSKNRSISPKNFSHTPSNCFQFKTISCDYFI